MSTTPPQTNVIDLPCVPVRAPDGSSTILSLRETFVRAHELADLGDALLPVEREAMLRLLESLGAAILGAVVRAGQDVDDLRDHLSDDPRFPQQAVDDFLDAHADLFDLADRDRPLLQEWHTPDPTTADLAKTFQPIAQLHVRVPGGSSATWGTTAERRDAGDPAVLLVLLAVAWFHGKPSNGAGASFYVPTSGAKCSPISGAPSGGPHDTVFHLVGDTLARSLLVNIPARWLTEPALPAWLDQDLGPLGTDDHGVLAAPGTLWRCTWTANRALVRWDGGRAVSFTRGLTQRPVPLVGVAASGRDISALKERAKAVSDGDYCRVRTPEGKNVHADARLRSAEGFHRWYHDALAGPVSAWVESDRALSRPGNGLDLAFHHEQGDTYGNRELSQWEQVPLEEFAATSEEQLGPLSVVTAHVSTIRQALKRALSEAGADVHSPVRARVTSLVMASLDAPVLNAVTRIVHDEQVDVTAVTRDMSDHARAAFVAATDPLLTPSTAALIYRARSTFAARTTVKEMT